MIKPNFIKLWNEFPDHAKYPNMKALYTNLGGQVEKNINVPGFGENGNTCASRLSTAFNKAGCPIVKSIAIGIGAKTLATKEGSLIIYQVEAFRTYLTKILGEPLEDKTTPFDDRFLGKKGIIAFDVNWRGATGHIALWNGITYREPSYDNYSTYVNPSKSDIKTSKAKFWELT